MLKTILRNLISNAIKFTEKNGIIKITAEKQSESVIISVSDNGVGIKKENIEKIWYNWHHHTTLGTANEKGSGLGLTLCKEFVEKHAGKIWVESEEGKGSNFNFLLPFKKKISSAILSVFYKTNKVLLLNKL